MEIFCSVSSLRDQRLRLASGLTGIIDSFLTSFSFMQGCDGSVLLTGANSEQADTPNQTLRQESLQLINQIKSTLEQTCPNTVSCADVTALAAAEAIKQVCIFRNEKAVGIRSCKQLLPSNVDDPKSLIV